MIYCDLCLSWGHSRISHNEEPLAAWERELLTGYREGEGDVIFKRTDGGTVRIEKVRVDSISPVATNSMVIAVEFFGNDDVVHVPFVESWTIEYK